MTPEQLAAIKARADKATAADALTLSAYAHGGGRLYVVGGPNAERQLVADFYDKDNRQFYYNARADVPALVAEVERLAAENARLRAVREAAQAWADDRFTTAKIDGLLDGILAALRADGGG